MLLKNAIHGIFNVVIRKMRFSNDAHFLVAYSHRKWRYILVPRTTCRKTKRFSRLLVQAGVPKRP